MKIVMDAGGPIDVDATLERYRIWGEDPANRLEDGAFRRVARLGEELIPYEVRWRGPLESVELEVHVPAATGTRVRDAIATEVRGIFGLDFDLPGFYRFAEREPVLRRLVAERRGLRPTLTPDPFEILVASITAQQVNLKFAFACRARLVRGHGLPVDGRDGGLHAFPSARALRALPVAALRALKFSTRKAEYIRDLASAIDAGELDFAALSGLANTAVIDRLTALRGVGRWTAEWFLARCLGRGDVCPAGDLAVRKAFEHYFGNGAPLGEETIRRRAQGWGEHQNLAVHYLLAAHRSARSAVAKEEPGRRGERSA